jgi:transposase-like protein/DNA-binding XRE family transcriptional regulator
MVEPWYFEVLPYRPEPYADECLSGYLARLAVANGIVDLWHLAGDLFPLWRVTRQLSLVRWEYPLDAWGLLSLRVQLSLVTLNQLTALAWVQKFRAPPVFTHPFRAGPGQILNGIIRMEDCICPCCFAETPYLRLSWRLSAVEVCLAHGCWLEAACPGCGQPLDVFSRRGLSVCCSRCGMDWRTLPSRPAPATVLAAQQQEQAGLRFLLDPRTSLVDGLPPAVVADGGTARSVGLKLRWLRMAAGEAAATLATRLGIATTTVNALERGEHVPLALYGRYVEAVGQTWPEVAGLTLTHAMVEQLTTPAHMALRHCPNPQCAASHLPPGLHIKLLRDLPEHRVARFRCSSCGRSFTRRYDGPTTTRTSRTRDDLPDLTRSQKTTEELERLVAWGREGRPNRWIAQQLGWGQKTVRTYWLVLGLEVEVHRAQAAWRRRQQEQRQKDLRAALEPVLTRLLSGDQEVALRDVARALGYNGDYLHSDPELAADLQTRLAQHNAEVRNQQAAVWASRVTDYCQTLTDTEDPVMLKAALARLDISWKVLRERYPDLALLLQTTIRSRQQQHCAACRAAQLAQIDAAAERLHARSVRLSQRAILLEAGLSLHSGAVPSLRQRLQHWVGDFPWNE